MGDLEPIVALAMRAITVHAAMTRLGRLALVELKGE
jgi:hypothetical protein